MRRSLRSAPAARSGFTLVELLVATALTILVMAIMATAFQTGMDTLSQLKSVVGLSEQLRSAQTVLERDLANPHLTDPSDSPVRVSSNLVTNTAWSSPNHGYLFILEPSQRLQYTATSPAPPGYTNDPNYTYLYEGTEDSLDSARATDHILQLTVQLSGKSPQEAFAAPAAGVTTPPPASAPIATMSGVSLTDYDPTGSQLVSRWAEVSYFLKPTSVMTVSDPTQGFQSLPMYTLYRRQRVLAPFAVTLAPGFNPANYPDLSTSLVGAGQYQLNGPDSLTTPANRLGGTNEPPLTAPPATWPAGVPCPYPISLATSPTYYGADVLLNNVLSFQVQVLCDQTVTIPGSPPTTSTIQSYQFSDLPGTAWPRMYDTTQAAGKPRLKAIQIKLRVYDTKNKMTRQVTINQDL